MIFKPDCNHACEECENPKIYKVLSFRYGSEVPLCENCFFELKNEFNDHRRKLKVEFK